MYLGNGFWPAPARRGSENRGLFPEQVRRNSTVTFEGAQLGFKLVVATPHSTEGFLDDEQSMQAGRWPVRSIEGKIPSPGRPSTAQHKHRFFSGWRSLQGYRSENGRIEAGIPQSIGRVGSAMAGGMPPIDLKPAFGGVSCPFLSGGDSHPLGEESGSPRHCPGAGSLRLDQYCRDCRP